MGNGLASARGVAGVERVDQAALRYEEAWRQGRPDLGRYLADSGGDASVSMIAALAKVDLRCRYERGERPAASEYLDRYPALRASGERVLSLVYEEYCLREEREGRPDTAEFCARYEPWKDSLESQLRYHRVLSRVVGTPPAPPNFPAAGERFEQFLIGDELGRGGAGRVYLARDESLGGRDVALKVSLDRGSEPAIMGRLKQDHIMPVLSVACQVRDGVKLRGLCMEYRPGLPLDEVIRHLAAGPGRPARAAALHDVLRANPAKGAADLVPGGVGWDTFPARGPFADGVAWVVAVLAEALAHAHGQEIYHRDVKPANVLLTYREGPQLLDFNLSHDPHAAVEAEAALRGGTLPYMAPEQLKAFLDPDRWGGVVATADLYSLGLLMRELLTGSAPETPDPMLPPQRAISALLDQRIDFEPDLRRLNPRVPHALDAIAGKCLAYAPGDRYQAADDLAEDLRRFLARRPLKHARNPSLRERAAHRIARNRTPITAALVAAAIALVVFNPLRPPVRLDPVSVKAALHLAAVGDESHGQYEAARKSLTTLVDAFDGNETSDERRLWSLATRLQRARVSIKWAKSLPDLDAARAHLDEAGVDLDRGDRLVKPADTERAFFLKYFRCERLLTLSEIAARRGRPDEAEGFRHEAGRLVATIVGCPPGWDHRTLDALKSRAGPQPRRPSPEPDDEPRQGD